MGLDQRSLVFLPFGYESEFPAYLTHRGGLDFGVVDLMRPSDHGGEILGGSFSFLFLFFFSPLVYAVRRLWP